MKRRILLSILAALILFAGTALAANPPVKETPSQTPQVPRTITPQSVVTLKVHPMLVEIETIRREMQEREDELLRLLLAATTEKDSDRIIRRIEILDTDRELALLKVQARYAHKEGRFDLEREIKQKIVGVLAADIRPIQ